MTQDFDISVATPETYPALIDQLAAILKACVDGGAGVHFLAPLALERGVRFWRDTEAAIRSGDRRLFYAHQGNRVLGTVQLVLGQTENGWHRAEISKMLVAPEARRMGVARALLLRAEADARAEKRELLFLDTVSDSPAEHLYAGIGYQLAGRIPNYAKYADGSSCPTSLMYKRLDGPAAG